MNTPSLKIPKFKRSFWLESEGKPRVSEICDEDMLVFTKKHMQNKYVWYS